MASILGASCSCAEVEDECMMSMDIKPLQIKNKTISYDHFDKNLGEHLIRLENGDLIIARYPVDCSLGFDLAYFSVAGFNNSQSKKQTAQWLISLYRDYPELKKLIKKALDSEKTIANSTFNVRIPGEFGDEKHVFTLKSVSISDDFISNLFTDVMTYSWLPPSGEE